MLPRKSKAMNTRNPASDLLSVLVVRLSKALSQRGLLVYDDEEIRANEPDRPINGERYGMRHQGFAQDDHRNAEIHRISHVPVEAANDQVPRWIGWGERAPTAPGKLKDARGKQHDTQTDAHEAEELRGTGQVELRLAESKESPRHVTGNNSRKQDRPCNAAQSEPSR
jgi:hypothetical protein